MAGNFILVFTKMTFRRNLEFCEFRNETFSARIEKFQKLARNYFTTIFNQKKRKTFTPNSLKFTQTIGWIRYFKRQFFFLKMTQSWYVFSGIGKTCSRNALAFSWLTSFLEKLGKLYLCLGQRWLNLASYLLLGT